MEQSPLNEEMIYINLVGSVFSFYEKYAISKITEFLISMIREKV